jgi:Major Facilitator Superfamily/ATP dependent DNA ligase C terminal region
VYAAVLVPAGKLADIVGRKRIFLAGLVVFLIGSALRAAASSVGLLIGARTLQAVGGAALIPTSLGLILPLVPTQKRAVAIGLWAALAGVGAAAGPPLGGLLDFGALLVGYYEGGRLRYAGKVGTGYSAERLAELGARLHGLEIRESPFADARPIPRGTHGRARSSWRRSGLPSGRRRDGSGSPASWACARTSPRRTSSGSGPTERRQFGRRTRGGRSTDRGSPLSYAATRGPTADLISSTVS